MVTYIVTIEQAYANHFRVIGAWPTIEEARAAVADRDYRIYRVEGDDVQKAEK